MGELTLHIPSRRRSELMAELEGGAATMKWTITSIDRPQFRPDEGWVEEVRITRPDLDDQRLMTMAMLFLKDVEAFGL